MHNQYLFSFLPTFYKRHGAIKLAVTKMGVFAFTIKEGKSNGPGLQPAPLGSK